MNITLFKPHKGQKNLIKYIDDDLIKYIVVPCGRRQGKTELSINAMIKFALENSRARILYLTARDDQRNTTFYDFLEKFGDAPFIDTINRTDYNITFLKTKSIIHFRIASLPSAQGLRGKKYQFIVMDEFALYRKEVQTTIVQPTLATYVNFKILFISSPMGMGQFHDLYLRGLDPNQKYQVSYTAPSEDNPYVNKEFIEDVKLQIPDKIFRQEYLAEFIDDVGSLFENIQECVKKPRQSKKYYGGIDVGFKNDYTVLTIINEFGELVEYLRFNDCSMTEGAKKINNVLKKYNYPFTYLENNQYQGLYELLELEGAYNIEEFNTNTKTKKEIIENLIILFQNKEIGLIDDEYLLSEFKNFGYEYNPKTRNIQYRALGDAHDDIVMSMALAQQQKKTEKQFVVQ